MLASAPALIATGWLIWHGRPAVACSEVVILVGVIAGMAWGIARRPTMLAAALEADRQLKWAELLSSAWLGWKAQTYRHDTWSAALLTEADARCADSSPSALAFRRFGGRGWGSIVLAVGLVITLGWLGPSAASSVGHLGRGDSGQSAVLALGVRDRSLTEAFFTSPVNRPILLPDPEDLNSNNSSQDNPSQAANGSATSTDAIPSDARAPAAPGDQALGSGSARTHPPADKAKAQLADGHGGAGSASSDKTAVQANGAGAPTGEPKAGNAANAARGGLMSGSDSRSTAPPPWKGANWPSDIQRAQIALDAGRIPAAYRDLVRGYFSAE